MSLSGRTIGVKELIRQYFMSGRTKIEHKNKVIPHRHVKNRTKTTHTITHKKQQQNNTFISHTLRTLFIHTNYIDPYADSSGVTVCPVNVY